MTDERPDSDRHLDRIAPLAEPVRRRLYEFVAAQGTAVDRDAAAAGVGIGRPLAAFHLDRLVAAGLLEVQYRRRSGRTGPGAGRPAKFYRRAGGEDISVSFPPRRYDLAAEILADGASARPEVLPAVLEAARAHGVELAAAAPAREGGRGALLAVLGETGFEPFVEPDGVIRLRNCPFHALVAEHRDLTCSMNLALLDAMADELGGSGLRADAQPREGFCCVAFVPDANGTRAEA